MSSKKGSARGMLLIVLVIGSIFIVIFYMGVMFSGIRVGVKEFQEDFFSIHNSIAPAKEFASTSLRYSVYQAMYDNGKRGGLKTIPDDSKYSKTVSKKILDYVVLHNYGTNLFGKKELLDSLKSQTLENLEKYTEDDFIFLDNFNVVLPKYTNIKVLENDDSFKVEAASDDNIKIEENLEQESVSIERKPDLTEEFKLNYFILFEKAMNFSGKDGENDVEKAISSYLEDNWIADSKNIQENVDCNKNELTDVDINDIFAETNKGFARISLGQIKIEEVIEAEIKSRINVAETEVFERKAEIIPICSMVEIENKCDEGDTTKTIEKSCIFSYFVDVVVSVTIEDSSGKEYPVYDSIKKKTALEPLSIVFVEKVLVDHP